ncbi:hypothetical protein [Vulcanisaeta distributa]|nr:hypothetical protein [Vulcanisaeta distributa]
MVITVLMLVSTYYAYQYLTRPMICMCPTVLLNNVYNTYVYYGNKLIYHN